MYFIFCVVLLIQVSMLRDCEGLKANLPPRIREIVRWRKEQGLMPLGGGAMSYRETLDSNHLPEIVRGLKLADCLPPLSNSSDTTRRRLNTVPAEQLSSARLLLGMLFLAAGGLDEAHAIAQVAMTKEYHYLHAMLHRQEGAAVGELGLTGWVNSQYWFGILEYHELFDAQLDHMNQKQPTSVLEAARLFAHGDPNLENWVEKFGGGRTRRWNAKAFVELCEITIGGKGPSTSAEEFCRRIITFEWDLLFRHICRGVGYQYDISS
jgi:hypothetical protein